MPEATKEGCPHEHLRFEDGTFLIVCIDCGQEWAARNRQGAFDYTLKGKPMYPPRNTRHDRWVMPRIKPLK